MIINCLSYCEIRSTTKLIFKFLKTMFCFQLKSGSGSSRNRLQTFSRRRRDEVGRPGEALGPAEADVHREAEDDGPATNRHPCCSGPCRTCSCSCTCGPCSNCFDVNKEIFFNLFPKNYKKIFYFHWLCWTCRIWSLKFKFLVQIFLWNHIWKTRKDWLTFNDFI